MRNALIAFTPMLLAIAGGVWLGWQQWQQLQHLRSKQQVIYPLRLSVLTPAPGQGQSATVTSVQDGDSLTLKIDGRQAEVRLCGIDAPELSQPYGQQAKAHLQHLIQHMSLMIMPVSKDQQGQTIAELFRVPSTLDSMTLLNVEMVEAGLAYAYSPFVQECPNREAIVQAEAAASHQYQGLWAALDPIKPWDYRRQYLTQQVMGNLAQANKLFQRSGTYLSDEIRQTLLAFASWYGPVLNGRPTANGEIFNQNALTAAHASLPFNTHLKVTNLKNGKSVVVRINDRQPATKQPMIDLSKAAAAEIGALQDGIFLVEMEVVDAGTVQPKSEKN